jgi:hypothetical protein
MPLVTDHAIDHGVPEVPTLIIQQNIRNAQRGGLGSEGGDRAPHLAHRDVSATARLWLTGADSVRL